MNLPEPECELGYTQDQVKEIVNDYEQFRQWIRGQTGGLCETKYTDCEKSHGSTTYKHDLRRYKNIEEF
jgi:hypothetical protein